MIAVNHFEYMRKCLIEILDNLVLSGFLPSRLNFARVSVEAIRDVKHGDVATNAAMVLAKSAELPAHDIANEVLKGLIKMDAVVSAEIAGPGFINITLSNDFWYSRLAEVLDLGDTYGNSAIGQGKVINIEYVSANPTGPMHVGHGRGAILGDVLANLAIKVGYNVTKEYYINDAGAQVEVLARSLYVRYLEALGETVNKLPEGFYPGDYLIPVGKILAEKDGNKWQNLREEEWLEPLRIFAIESMMDLIREDLMAIGVVHDVFSSERNLVKDNSVDNVLKILEERNLIYKGVLEPPKGKRLDDWEKRPQILFSATKFGDDVDRPLKKFDGSWTYFATDMAYHFNKFKRGFSSMIDIWGADHGGYVKRMQAAVKALTEDGATLDVKLCQMVNLIDNGEPVKMSKRSGTFITLREVIDKVGKDVVRFMMLTRKRDAQLDFDLSKVMEQSRDNPVFYVQYSHARCRSVLRHAAEMFNVNEIDIDFVKSADFKLLSDPAELALIKIMAAWPETVESAAEAREPHRIAYYLHGLSAAFHALWTKGSNEDTTLRFLSGDDRTLTQARMALVKALSIVIASGLEVMGVKPVEEMR